MTILHIDFESRSTLDLTEVGLDNYANCADTDIWCAAFAFDDEPVELWIPGIEELPERVREHVYNGREFIAHNAPFEIAMWNHIVKKRYGGPTLLPASCTCTMAMAYAMALPGALDAAASAVGLGIAKNADGRRLMLQMCRPRTTQPLTWWDDPAKVAGLASYCKQDVEVERALHKRLMPLSPAEKKIWQLDFKVNSRGILIDQSSVAASIKVVQHEQERLNAELKVATGGVVDSVTQVAQLTKWVRSQGVEVPGLAKGDIIESLANEDIPANVRQALLIRQEAGRASTAKLAKMLTASSSDGRLRNALQYHGASTGRWAGRLVQVHNLPRPTIHDDNAIDYAFKLVNEAGSPEEAAQALNLTIGAPSEVLVSMLRGMFVPSGDNYIAAGDFANIEGRGLAWQAGEQWKLDAFAAYDAGTGPDMYRLTYSRSFGIPLDKVTGDQRQVGKVEELALGYQGSVGAFQMMAKAYNVKLPDAKVKEVVYGWRNAHPAIVNYWEAVKQAAMAATLHPGQKFTAGPQGRHVTYLRRGSFLMCLLPCNSVIFYPYPEIRMVKAPWDEMIEALTYKTVPNQTTKLVDDPTNNSRWARVSTHGGKLVQNNTEGICRKLLAEAMERLDAAGFDIVLHVHDEVVAEISSYTQADEIKRIMEVVPAWATGLPIAVEAWAAKRYKKD